MGIFHRDLKSHNVVVADLTIDEQKQKGDQINVKLIDFGSAKDTMIMSMPMTLMPTGTSFWIAPEIWEHQAFSPAADVYSFSIVLWEMASVTCYVLSSLSAIPAHSSPSEVLVPFPELTTHS